MADGQEFTMPVGGVFITPRGHDSWVIGNELYVSIHQ